MTGTGPGTFEFWWAEHGTIPGFVRDAHSLFFETLGEMGVVGFALIAALVFGVVAVGAWRVVTAPVASRPWLAAATAAAAAFAGAAAIDWAWELAVLPVVFLLLAAAVLAPGLDAPAVPSSYRPAPRPRVALSALALAGLVAVAVPFASSSWLRASQDDVSGGQLGSALDNARQAADIEPYAATPSLQQALVLELEGDLGGRRRCRARGDERGADELAHLAGAVADRGLPWQHRRLRARLPRGAQAEPTFPPVRPMRRWHRDERRK